MVMEQIYQLFVLKILYGILSKSNKLILILLGILIN